MPFVHVRLTGPVTPEQKDRVIKGMTDVLVTVLGKDPAATWVVLDEISKEDWGINGASAATHEKAGAKGAATVAAAKAPTKPVARAKAKA